MRPRKYQFLCKTHRQHAQHETEDLQRRLQGILQAERDTPQQRKRVQNQDRRTGEDPFAEGLSGATEDELHAHQHRQSQEDRKDHKLHDQLEQIEMLRHGVGNPLQRFGKQVVDCQKEQGQPDAHKHRKAFSQILHRSASFGDSPILYPKASKPARSEITDLTRRRNCDTLWERHPPGVGYREG